MRALPVALALVGLVTLTAATASAVRVRTDHDREADFSQFKTWAWMPVAPGPKQARLHQHPLPNLGNANSTRCGLSEESVRRGDPRGTSTIDRNAVITSVWGSSAKSGSV